jgi:hypothetical protein
VAHTYPEGLGLGWVDQAHGEVSGLQELEEGEVIGAGWLHRDGLGMVEAEGSQQSLLAFRGVGEAEVSLVAWAEEGQVQVGLADVNAGGGHGDLL